MKYEIELHEEEIKNLKRIRNYFGEHDKTMLEHMAYDLLDKIVENLNLHFVSQQCELLIDFYYKLSQRSDTNLPALSIGEVIDMYEKGNL